MQTKNPLVLGVDGCKAGWALCSGRSEETPTLSIFPNMEDVLKAFPDAQQIVLDMPVGLPEESVRSCDTFLRSLLPWPRSSSVFNAPVRKAVYAKHYVEACRLQQAATGKKISIQSWNICPKIREVDESLRHHKKRADKIMESHPEVFFWSLNHGKVFPSKHVAEGQKFRLNCLTALNANLDLALRTVKGVYPSREVTKIDWIDAMVLWAAASGAIPSVIWPETTICDSSGIRMRLLIPEKFEEAK